MQIWKAHQSTISAARRRQIVAATTIVLSREGHGGATLSRIAAEAGLSSAGMITYHFTDRRQLLLAVVSDVIGRYDAAVRSAVDGAASAASALDAYIEAAVRFQDVNRDDVRALWQVIWSLMDGGSGPVIDKDAQLRPLLDVLVRGKEDGEFRTDIDDPRWVAKSIHATVTGYMDVFAADPDVDAGAYIHEVQLIYALATRRPGRRPQRKDRT